MPGGFSRNSSRSVQLGKRAIRGLTMYTFAQKPKAARQNTSPTSTMLGRGHFGHNHEVNSILHLQRTIGNQALQRSLQTSVGELNSGLTRTASPQFKQDFGRIFPHAEVRMKLAISTPGDAYEQEADRVAEQVMRMPEPQLERTCSCGGECPNCRNAGGEHEQARAKQMQVDRAVELPVVHEALRSAGQSMDSDTQSFFERRFGHDFSQVRVHTDARAIESARAVNAQAYTVGSHVVFGEGQYAPETRQGRQLLAHELTHVIQQQSAAHVVHQGAATVRQVLQRQPDSEVLGAADGAQAGADQGAQQRICGPDITTSLTTMLGTVEPWFRGLTGFQQSRSCLALGPAAPLVGVNPIMAWDTRELFLPNTDWLDAYFRRGSCGSPRDSGCDTDPTRNLCETAGTCGNSVVVDGKCMLAGTANYALFGKMCRLCHDYTGRWNRWDMRAIIGAYKTVALDDSTPPKEVASAAYDGTFPTVSAAAENRGTCPDRCGQTHGGAFDFIWEPYRTR